MALLFKKHPITGTLTIGQQLRAARRRKRLRLTDVETALKIRREYIEALESDRFEILPGQAYIKQFLKAYAILLGLKPAQLLEELMTLTPTFSANEDVLVPSSLKYAKIYITPKVMIVTCLTVVVMGVVGYITYQVEQFSRPPKLEVQYPTDGVKVISKIIDVLGQASPGSVVTINGEPVSQQVNGQFSQPVQLAEGLNTLQVVAKNRFNKQSERRISVIKPREEEQAKLID